MTIQDGYFECDLCGKSTSGEYNTDTGNHTACAELATLRAQLAEARETLQPFANVAKVWDGVNVMTSPIIAYSHADGDVLVYLDDFRAARAWYDKVTTA